MSTDLPWFYFDFAVHSSKAQTMAPQKAGREFLQHFKARRIAPQQEFMVTNGRGALYRCRLDGQQILFLQSQPQPEPNQKLRLLLPALEKSRLNPLIAQLTSLGIGAVFFYRSEYSQPRRMDRTKLKAVSRAALTQCKRTQAIHFPPPQTLHLTEWLSFFERGAAGDRLWFMPALQDQNAKLQVALDERPAYLLVGPEGGFGPTEQARLQEIIRAAPSCVRPIKLGPYILRTETAALALTAVVQGHFD